MNASFSPEVVGIIRNKILATIEEVLSIKFPFIRDLGIISNPFYSIILLIFLWENDPTNKELDSTAVRNIIKIDLILKKMWIFRSNLALLDRENEKVNCC